MPANFLTMVYYLLGLALVIALLASIVAVGFTIFVGVFTYVFIPLLIIAGIRYLWIRWQLRKTERITYYDEK